jgi:hypothetical protein
MAVMQVQVWPITAVNQWQICSLSQSISAFDHVSFSTGTFFISEPRNEKKQKKQVPVHHLYFSIFYITYHSEDNLA